MIKVNYDQITTLVLGYYPDSVNYNSIPMPNIEIEDNEQILDKTMCVKNGVYQEFIKPDSELLQEAKDSKIAEIKANKDSFIYLPVDYNGSTFKNTEISGKNLETAYNFIDEPIQWLDIQDNTIALTKLQVKDLITLMISHRSTGYFLEASLINQVKACLTTAEVNNIDITFI